MRSAECSLAIIVVGYNSEYYLHDCFESIGKSTFTDYKIILIDNDSSDQTVSYVKDQFPEVEVIQTGVNLGFAGGNNVGIRRALELGFKYILLLNPDTVVDRYALEILVKKADSHTILQPVLLLFSDCKTKEINTTGNHLHYLGFSYCGDYKQDSSGLAEREIVSASGAAAFVPSTVFKKIGFLDEFFFMYHEDLDFCWRARMHGFSVRLIPQARIWHKYSFSRNDIKLFFAERNRILFLLKNYEIKTLVLIFPLLFVNGAGMFFYSLISGNGNLALVKLRGYWSIFRNFRTCLATRRKTQQNRIVGDAELKTFISTDLSFSEVKIPRFYNKVLSAYWKLISKVV